MIALKPKSSWSRFFQGSPGTSRPTVWERDEFRRLVRRERLRADRNGETFSLVLMEAPVTEKAGAYLSELTKVLQARLRATDDVGRVERDRLGVLLPDTPAAGAWTVVEHIGRLLPKEVTAPACEVFTYPSFHDTTDEPEKRRLDRNERLSPVHREHAGEGAAAVSGKARRMEALFSVRLPWWKRSFDVLGAAIGLIALSPVLALTAVAVKSTSPGPLLFKQYRRGQGGRAFLLYKFRSMVDGAEEMQKALRHQNEQDGPAFKMKADPRITRVGGFLRRTGLDEFPQLWNVLKGDMTLVGPRPLPCHESDASETWQQRRLDVKPGLTCIWQSRGQREVSFADWMRMDMRYVKQQRPWLDIVLVAKTAWMVLRSKASG